MTAEEQYEFDRSGYLVIPGMLAEQDVASLSEAVETLLSHAEERVDAPPRITSRSGTECHRDDTLGYHVRGKRAVGGTLIIEDFFNSDPAFDTLVNHPKTLGYIRPIFRERPAINNSELRVRYRGNVSGMHMGGPVGGKYRYGYRDNQIDCMMVRMIYFVHDVAFEQGAFCVVPGTHKSNVPSPYLGKPEDDPGVVALEVKAGDAILFTENLRHGGVTNGSSQVRKTLHVGYGPFWLKSQNIATMDEDPYLLDATRARYDEEQKRLFHTYVEPQS